MTATIQTFIALLLISASGLSFMAGQWHGQVLIYSQLLNNMQQVVSVVGVRK